jgi:hypothetical protein
MNSKITSTSRILQRMKLISFALACVLSLVFSSFAAGICSHGLAARAGSSCHKAEAQKSDDGMSGMPGMDGSNETADTCISDSGCCCVDRGAVKFAARAKSLIVQNEAAEIFKLAPEELVAVSKNSEPATVFSRPLYLTDSFHNLAPVRGPPSL